MTGSSFTDARVILHSDFLNIKKERYFDDFQHFWERIVYFIRQKLHFNCEEYR